MSLIKANAAAVTDGIAPKVAWPTAVLAAAGAVLCILDLLGVIVLDDGVWIALLGAAGSVGVIGHRAPAAVQKVKEPPTLA